MKKLIVCLLLWAPVVPAFGDDLSGLDKWVLDFPAAGTEIAGRKITTCVVERTGALVAYEREGVPVRVSVIKPVALNALASRLGAVEKSLLDGKALASDRWNIAVSQCDIDLGLKDEMTVTLRFSSFRFRLNAQTILDLAPRLEADPVFRLQAADPGFSYTLRFRGIAPGAGGRDAFPGWPAYVAGAVKWFQDGINADNQEILALVLDTKVMSLEDKQSQKRIVLSKDTRSQLWVGLNVDYLMSHLFCSQDDGLSLIPAGYNLLQPMLYLSWRNLGEKEWLARPYQVSVAFGGFFEYNVGYYYRADEYRFQGYPASDLNFKMAFGPSVSAEFTAMIPRIVNGRYTDDLLGVGLELLTIFNVPYFFPDYYYEYFLVQYINLVLHVIPANGAGLDVIAGLSLAFTTTNFDETSGEIRLDKAGISVGVRLKIDFYNFFLSDRMFD